MFWVFRVRVWGGVSIAYDPESSCSSGSWAVTTLSNFPVGAGRGQEERKEEEKGEFPGI